MQIMTLDGTAIMNSDEIDSIYIAESKNYTNCAVRCSFTSSGSKDMSLAVYDTQEHAKQAIKILFDAFRLGYSAVKMPKEEEVERKRAEETAHVRERAENGKKTVRRGGS